MLRTITIAALLCVALAGGYLMHRHANAPPPSPVVPAGVIETVAFTLPDLDGTPHEFSEWQGKARLVNFWATWCAPCRREIPLLKDTQAQHADDNVQVIGIAVDFHDEVKSYAERAEFNYPILIGEDDAMAVAESAGVDFIGLPFTLIVAPDGSLLAAHMGEIVSEQMDQVLAELGRLQRGDTDVKAARDALKNL